MLAHLQQSDKTNTKTMLGMIHEIAEDGDDEMSVGKQSDIDRKKKVAHVDDGMLKRDERAGGDAENDSGVVKVRRALRF